MYHAFVRRKIIENFEGLGANAAASGNGQLHPDVEHVFAGDGAIGGTRSTADGFRTWVERVYRLFPDLKFTVRETFVSGGPFDTRVAVEWTSSATTATGEPYTNDGVHIIRLRRGKIISMHVYLDTGRVDKVMSVMAARGFVEAAADPIEM